MHKLIARLLDINQRHSEQFIREQHARRQHRHRYPTELGIIGCMDGRVHPPSLMQTPLGICKEFRLLGGKLDVGWPAFQPRFTNWVEYAIRHGRDCLLLVTYHFARGSEHRGCRGFDYDVNAARAYTAELTQRINLMFGGSVLYAVQCGIETDDESMIIHGQNGEIVDLAEVTNEGNEISSMLSRLFPTMPPQVITDFMPHVAGNIRHVAEIRASGRPIADAQHKEWMLGVGHGYDWLHLPNTALLVDQAPLSLDDSIVTAARLLLNNITEHRINGDGVILASVTPYYRKGYHRELAIAQATCLADHSYQTIQQQVPELLPHMCRLTAVICDDTRHLEVITTA